MIFWLLSLLAYGLSVYLAGAFLPGVDVFDYQTAVIVAFGLWIVNRTIKPIFTVLTLPISVLTLGLFYLCINAIMIYFVAYLIDGFTISNFLWALLLGLVLSILNSTFDFLIGKTKKVKGRKI